MEIFKPIKGYEGYYEISDIGNVKSVRIGKILKPNIDKSGYKYFVFSVDSRRKTLKAHRLVAENFIPNVENKPTVDHINGIRTDNRVENLRWATNKEQSNNAVTIKKHKQNNPPSKMRAMGEKVNFNRKRVIAKKNGFVIGEYESLKQAAKENNINYTKASEILNGKRKRKDGIEFCIAVTKKHFKEEKDGESNGTD